MNASVVAINRTWRVTEWKELRTFLQTRTSKVNGGLSFLRKGCWRRSRFGEKNMGCAS